jgi:hypothetical protein
MLNKTKAVELSQRQHRQKLVSLKIKPQADHGKYLYKIKIKNVYLGVHITKIEIKIVRKKK